MKLPDKYEVLVITLSDRAYRGEYQDLSGPRIREKLLKFFKAENWKSNIENVLIPDDAEALRDLVVRSAVKCNFIFTTGGTGIGPHDVTVEAISPLLTKVIPGIMEFIRVKYGMENPGALLSRGVAGITGNALIYTLPGSLKAVEEYMDEITRTLRHTVLMQYGVDTHTR